MSALITAIWTGPFPAEIGWPPRTVHPGEEAQVTEADLGSTHWQRKQPARISRKSSETHAEADA